MTKEQMAIFVEVQCIVSDAKDLWATGNFDKTFEEFLQITLDAIKLDAELEQ